MRHCLYARKSSESEEMQVLSIDSQIKEMLSIAEREKLEVVEMKRESHSAKASGQRPVYNEIISAGKFNGILTWAPDRLSRNAGDLGMLVDLMDQKLLLKIRTYSQRFTDSLNEKFLLMILDSQAKLENDNRGINIRRGMKTRVEMGLWPAIAPLGYLNENRSDRPCQVIVDPARGQVVRQMFEKVAHEKWSGRKSYRWLKYDLNFKTRNDKALALGGVFRMLVNPFYYGMIEYPRGGPDRGTSQDTGPSQRERTRHPSEVRAGDRALHQIPKDGAIKHDTGETEVNIRTYTKYLLREGSVSEKRDLLSNLRSRLVYRDKTLTLLCEASNA